MLAAGASVDLQNNDGARARALELMGVASGGMRRGGWRV